MKKFLICNKNFDKKKIKDLIEWFLKNYGSIKTSKILKDIKFLGFKYSTKAGISLGPEDLLVPKLKKSLIKNTEKYIEGYSRKLYSGKINNLQYMQKITDAWTIVNETLRKDIVKNFRQIDLMNPVYIMIFSGARGNISQIKQLVGMRGLMSDSKGEIINSPIKNNLKEGLNQEEYFISCYGARKGIIDTALKTSNSGYLTRKLVYVSQNIFITQPDCKTKAGVLVKIVNNTKKNYLEVKEKIIGKVLNENIILKKGKKILFTSGQDLCNYIVNKILEKRRYILVRTSLNCKLNIGICQLCYGWNLANNKIVNLGEAVGILAAQSIGEPGTQLTMRTFHTGGVFSGEIMRSIQSPISGKVFYSKNFMKNIITKYGEKAFFLQRDKLCFVKKNSRNLTKIKIPRYSIFFVNTNEKVFKKQLIAEIPHWKKLFNINNNKDRKFFDIKANNSGQLYFKLNKKKKTVWLMNGSLKRDFQVFNNFFNKKIKIIKYYEKFDKTFNKKKFILNFFVLRKFKKILNIFKENKIDFYIIKNIKKRQILTLKEVNKKTIKHKLKNISIGQFVRSNKLSSMKNNGFIVESRIKIFILKNSFPYFISNNVNFNIKNNSIINKNSIIFSIICQKEKTNDIVEGLPKVEQILEARRTNLNDKNNFSLKLKQFFKFYEKKYGNFVSNKKSILRIQLLLVKSIQKVYNSQGVIISDKHIQLIIKQMTSKVIVKDQGDSNFISGEIVNLNKLEKINKTIFRKVKYEPVLLGISKVSVGNDSFLSAASFQETTRVLTKSALMGSIDWLKGLKENIIMGNLIPIGTSYEII